MLTLYSVLIIVCLLTILIGQKITKSARAYRQAHALATIRQLQKLIAVVQKHRGTCATCIQGNKEAKSSIVSLRHEIGKLSVLLNANQHVLIHARWQGFTDHWSRLEKNALSLDVQSNFEQHTNMIQNLLFLFEDLAEEFRFTKSFFTEFPDIALLWRELPLTVEFIGQARAVGVSVSTLSHCSQVDKIKLGYLHRKISQLTRIVLKHLKNSAVMDKEAMSKVKLAEQSCLNLISTIHKDLLTTTSVSITPQQYFAIASEAMDATNAVIEFQLCQVESSLK